MPVAVRPAEILTEMVGGDSIVIPTDKLAGYRNAARFLKIKLVTSAKELPEGKTRVWRSPDQRNGHAKKGT